MVFWPLLWIMEECLVVSVGRFSRLCSCQPLTVETCKEWITCCFLNFLSDPCMCVLFLLYECFKVTKDGKNGSICFRMKSAIGEWVCFWLLYGCLPFDNLRFKEEEREHDLGDEKGIHMENWCQFLFKDQTDVNTIFGGPKLHFHPYLMIFHINIWFFWNFSLCRDL